MTASVDRRLLLQSRMLRLAWMLLLLLACKPSTDRTGPDGGTSTKPDGATDEVSDDATIAVDDGGTPIDASPTICQEATLHSDFAWLQAHVLTPSCAVVGCHTGADAEVGLRLDLGEAYNNLVNKGSSTQPGWVRVVPGSTSTSYLVVSFGRAAGPPPPDGFMPLGADALCVEKHEAVERWIAAGALP